MRGYSTVGSNATGTANKTLVTVVAASTVRPAIFDVVCGCSATPSDQATNMAVQRFTVAGTGGTTTVPTPLDSAGVAALTASGQAHSVEPTYTSNTKLLQFSMNQRATFRWVASPGFELIAPATAANGIGLYLVTATATTVYDGTLIFYE